MFFSAELSGGGAAKRPSERNLALLSQQAGKPGVTVTGLFDLPIMNERIGAQQAWYALVMFCVPSRCVPIEMGFSFIYVMLVGD